jgi:hypothetical protein
MGAVTAEKQTSDLMKELSSLITGARQVLRRNDLMTYIVPSKGLYPHQVLWDSCFVSIGLSHYDLDKAKLQILRLFSAQWENGMIPHIVFTDGPKFWWDRRIWRSRVSPLSVKKRPSSGVSQPPMLAEAITQIGKKMSSEDRIIWYKSIFEQLVDYHSWLYRERDPKGQGIVVQLHPWEIGLDNSPPCIVEVQDKIWPWWLRFLDTTRLDRIGNFFRVDTKFVPNGQRSSNIEALALYNLLRKIRRAKYDSQLILKDPSFAMEDITYNSILARANVLLSEIANEINERLPEELVGRMKLTSTALEKLWDENDKQYYSRKFQSRELIKVPSIGTFLPLYSGSISKDRAAELVKHLKDKNSFNTDYSLPTVPLNSDWFNPKCYWQGPVWVNTNWLIIDGLKRYGFYEEAKQLTMTTLKVVEKSGFHEYFDPITGEARGANNFSWTAALSLDLAYKLAKK